jgi:hypothetical protein
MKKQLTIFDELEKIHKKEILPKIVQEIRKAVLDMLSKIEYTDSDHVYKLKSTGKWLQGVSSVSSILPKDWLAAWGAKEAVKFLGYSDYEGDLNRATEVLKDIKKMKTPEQLIELLKEAKGASSRKSKDALVDGKAGHAWLETYVKARIRHADIPSVPEGNLNRPITQFLKWEAKEIDYWILSEAKVVNEAKEYAGCLDALAMLKNGTLAIIDFKFASHISEDYYLQTAGYQACFEPYNIKIDNRIILRFPKTVLREEYNVKKQKYEMKPNNLEPEWVKGSYEFDRDVFFHALPLKAWSNQFTQKKWSKPKVEKKIKLIKRL